MTIIGLFEKYRNNSETKTHRIFDVVSDDGGSISFRAGHPRNYCKHFCVRAISHSYRNRETGDFKLQFPLYKTRRRALQQRHFPEDGVVDCCVASR